MANRRSVLIGLGGLVAGGGALLGTGAFDAVEAQRDVTVETSGDADAFLGLTPAEDVSDELVEDPGDGTIEIVLNDTDAGGSGLNQNAMTTFNELVTITNQGTQTIEEITLDLDQEDEDEDVDLDGVFSYPVDGDTAAPVENGGDLLDDDDDGLGPGSEVTFGLIVDLLDDDNPSELPEDADYALTIEANAAD